MNRMTTLTLLLLLTGCSQEIYFECGNKDFFIDLESKTVNGTMPLTIDGAELIFEYKGTYVDGDYTINKNNGKGQVIWSDGDKRELTWRKLSTDTPRAVN